MLGVLSFAMCNKGRNKIPCGAPYQAIRDTINYLDMALVDPPLILTTQYSQHERDCIKCHPAALIKTVRLADEAPQASQPETATCAFENRSASLKSLFQDGDVQLRMTYQGVVHLRGGCASVPDGTSEILERKEALRVATHVRGMSLTIR